MLSLATNLFEICEHTPEDLLWYHNTWTVSKCYFCPGERVDCWKNVASCYDDFINLLHLRQFTTKGIYLYATIASGLERAFLIAKINYLVNVAMLYKTHGRRYYINQWKGCFEWWHQLVPTLAWSHSPSLAWGLLWTFFALPFLKIRLKFIPCKYDFSLSKLGEVSPCKFVTLQFLFVNI